VWERAYENHLAANPCFHIFCLPAFALGQGKSLPGTATMPVDEFLESAQEAAHEGIILAKKVSAWHSSQLREYRRRTTRSFSEKRLDSISGGCHVALNLYSLNPVVRANVPRSPSQKILSLMQVQCPMICYEIMAAVMRLRRVVVLDNVL
jgi:hypothetical protein